MGKTTWRISISNIIVAGIFIYIGTWFLLSNLGLLNGNMKNALITFIPYVLVVYGLWLLIRPFIKNRGLAGDWLFGLFFFPYGALLLADHFGWTTFSWVDGWKLWPMIIIYVGSVILFHKKS
jgi:lia operon protein LiaF